MARICVFDVNETLLDLSALDRVFDKILGDASMRTVWFSQMLQCALTATVTDVYADFGATGAAALEMVGAATGAVVTDGDKQSLREAMQSLPPHPEVEAAIRRLKEAGVRVATLTNSKQEVADAQLRHAGLDALFEECLSADEVRRLKPAPEPYVMVADKLGVAVDGIRMVAAHAWDIAGALRAGCAAAFVARPGKVLDPLVERPDVIGADLEEVARSIIEVET